MLARTMGCTVAELEERMSGDEFVEHFIDYRLEPWGEEKWDLRTAAMMEAVVGAAGGKLTREQAFKTLRQDGDRKPKGDMSINAMKRMLRLWG